VPSEWNDVQAAGDETSIAGDHSKWRAEGISILLPSADMVDVHLGYKYGVGQTLGREAKKLGEG